MWWASCQACVCKQITPRDGPHYINELTQEYTRLCLSFSTQGYPFLKDQGANQAANENFNPPSAVPSPSSYLTVTSTCKILHFQETKHCFIDAF